LDEDPLDFRARHLDDPRALAVLDRLRPRLAMDLPEGEAIGVAIGRYKGKAAYAGVAAHIRLDETPRLLNLWAVVDAGRIVSHSGALNQIEGGMIQAASWTLCEGAWLRDGQIDASGWADYPTLGWGEIPTLHVDLIDADADAPPLGVGECMVGPTSAAIVNAVSAVLGQTLADLPLNRDTLVRALSA
jgi:CO/xanthine dehydrogenase Mo-binding subunit